MRSRVIDVPNVSAPPFELYSTGIMVCFRCSCSPSNPPAILYGIDSVLVCSRCKRKFQLAQLFFDATLRDHPDPEQAERASKVGVGLAVETPAIVPPTL